MNHVVRSAVQTAAQHLANAAEHYSLARASHSETRQHLRRMADAIDKAQGGSGASGIAARLPDVADARADALAAHTAAAGSFTRAHRAVATAAETLRQVSAQNDPVAEGALGNLEGAIEQHESGRTLHNDAGEKLTRTLHALGTARGAAKAGLDADARAALGDAGDLIGDAIDAHGRAGGHFAKSHASVRTAADRLNRALAPDDGGGSYVEPTHDLTSQGGAQVSDGREPRALTVEEIRQRDQRRACHASYNAEMRRRLNGGGHGR